MEDKSSPYEALKAWILRLPRVTEAPHRLGGTEFQVNGAEFMHFHGLSWLDIRLSKEDQASVLKTGQALPTGHRCTPKMDGLAPESRTRKISRTQRMSYSWLTRTQRRIREISSLAESKRVSAANTVVNISAKSN